MPTRKQRKTCKHCKKKFTPARADQLYCSQACGQFARRSEQDKDKVLLSKLYNTGFFSYLHYQSKRAGTVEVVPKKLEDLSKLHSIWSYNNKANAYCKEREYEISHIHPVCGVQGRIGTLHPANLVVQPATFNRLHGTKHLGNGHSISKYRLKPEWCIPSGAEKADIIELIFKRIGIPTLKQFNKDCKPTTLAVIKELEWFEKHVCLLDDSVVLDQLDLEQLRELRAGLTGKKVFHLDFTPYFEHDVISSELARLAEHRPDLASLAEWASELVAYRGPYSPEVLFVVARLQPVLAGASFSLASLQNQWGAKQACLQWSEAAIRRAEQEELELALWTSAQASNSTSEWGEPGNDTCPF